MLRIDWSRKSHNYTEEEIEQISSFIRNANSFTQAEEKICFEQEFSKYTGNKNCFAVSSCTAALELCTALCNFKKDDEVITTPHTWCSTVIPFLRYGVNIKWADINPDTRLISANSIEKNITKKTKAIIVVHLYGLMCDMDPIISLARKHNLIVIEDCAQSLGAKYNGTKCGNFGDFACYSFHTQKNFTTLGEGGILSVRDDNVAKRVPALMHNGVTPYEDQVDYWLPAMNNICLDGSGVIPFNFCLSEIQCFVGRLLLKRIDEMNLKRQRMAVEIKKKLKVYQNISFQSFDENKYEHVYHLLPAKFDATLENKTRDDLIRKLYNDYGIKCIVQFLPLYRYDLFIKMGFSDASCPNTDNYFDNMISFPFYEWMNDDDLHYQVSSISNVLKEFEYEV